MPRSAPLKDGKQSGGPVLTTTEARQGTTEGVVRYVLMISLALATAAFILLYAVYFWPG